jgi:hypothetical protein
MHNPYEQPDITEWPDKECDSILESGSAIGQGI